MEYDSAGTRGLYTPGYCSEVDPSLFVFSYLILNFRKKLMDYILSIHFPCPFYF